MANPIDLGGCWPPRPKEESGCEPGVLVAHSKTEQVKGWGFPPGPPEPR